MCNCIVQLIINKNTFVPGSHSSDELLNKILKLVFEVSKLGDKSQK